MKIMLGCTDNSYFITILNVRTEIIQTSLNNIKTQTLETLLEEASIMKCLSNRQSLNGDTVRKDNMI